MATLCDWRSSRGTRRCTRISPARASNTARTSTPPPRKIVVNMNLALFPLIVLCSGVPDIKIHPHLPAKQRRFSCPLGLDFPSGPPAICQTGSLGSSVNSGDSPPSSRRWLVLEVSSLYQLVVHLY